VVDEQQDKNHQTDGMIVYPSNLIQKESVIAWKFQDTNLIGGKLAIRVFCFLLNNIKH
jgi:hypothetical protein